MINTECAGFLTPGLTQVNHDVQWGLQLKILWEVRDKVRYQVQKIKTKVFR